MAEIRLSKLTRQFNIGLGTLIEFLNEKGAGISSNDPNFKVSDEFLPVLQAKFGGDQAMKQDSEKVATKLKEMIDSSKKKNPTAEEEDPAEKEILIKTNVINSQSDKPAVKAAEPVVEPEVAQPEPEAVEPEPVADAAELTPQEAYIAKYAPVAVKEIYRSGVPASITLAQGLLESRYG